MSVMEMEQTPPVRVRRSFTEEFKRDAVSLVLDEARRIVDVASSLGIGDGTLGNWVRQARTDRGEREGLTTEEKAELARLRKENARLRMERDLLKRATAFWVKESGQ
jgi:transposase